MLYADSCQLGAGLSASRRAWERVSLHELSKTFNKRNLTIMKKTLIALLVLVGGALGATTTSYTWDANTTTALLGGTLSGSFTSTTYTPNEGIYEGENLTVINGSTYYETGTSILTDWLKDALAGNSQFVISGSVTLGSSTAQACFLHVGADGKGLSFGVKNMQFQLTNSHFNPATGATAAITFGAVPLNSSANDEWFMTDYSVTIGKGGVITYSINGGAAVTLDTKYTANWSTTAADDAKYSIGNRAPGWTGYVPLNDNVRIGEITISRVIPEPATATLSLLALAGLAARRRRR